MMIQKTHPQTKVKERETKKMRMTMMMLWREEEIKKICLAAIRKTGFHDDLQKGEEKMGIQDDV